MHRTTLACLMALGSAVFVIGCDDDDDDPVGPVTETFRATLTGTAERPTPRETPADGTADFTFRNDTLFWTIQMSDIENVVMAHIHVGTADVAGGIILSLTPPVSNTEIENFTAREDFEAPSAPNQNITFDDLLDLMRSGGAYVNVHTNDPSNDPTNDTGPGDFPGGEIRGQIAKIT